MDNSDHILRKRYWIETHFPWFLSEITFHRDNQKYFSNQKLVVWHYGDEPGSISL